MSTIGKIEGGAALLSREEPQEPPRANLPPSGSDVQADHALPRSKAQRRINRSKALMVLFVLLTAGCDKPSVSPNAGDSVPTPSSDIQHLLSQVKEGVHSNELTAWFGEPFFVHPTGENKADVTYIVKDISDGPATNGFLLTVEFVDGLVANSYVHEKMRVNSEQLPSNISNLKFAELRFESDNNEVFVAQEPMSILPVQSETNGTEVLVTRIAVGLDEEDAEQFHKFTAKHEGGEVHVNANGVSLGTLLLFSSIEDGQFEIKLPEGLPMQTFLSSKDK